MPEKIEINPELRWKAFLRAQLRAAFDLFHFGGYVNKAESGLNVEGRRNIARRLKTDSQINSIVRKAKIEELSNLATGERGPRARVMRMPTTFVTPKVSLDASESLHPWARDDLFVNAWHEVMHTQAENKLNKNDFLLAHAVGEYFKLIQFPDPFSSGKIMPADKAKLIERSFVKGTRDSVVKSYRGDHHHAEYSAAFPSGESFAQLGRILGRGAVKLEGQLGISGIGLIFIRELSRGGTVDFVVKKIKKRKAFHTRELVAWYKRHPGVKRYLLNPRDIGFSHPVTQRKLRVAKAMKEKLRKKAKRKNTSRNGKKGFRK